MATTTVRTSHSRRKWRLARTNRGKFASLETRYWRGDLDEAQEEAFEALCWVTHRLYQDVSA
jgi:hypothetical protein